jgi:hypothetical protein
MVRQSINPADIYQDIRLSARQRIDVLADTLVHRSTHPTVPGSANLPDAGNWLFRPDSRPSGLIRSPWTHELGRAGTMGWHAPTKNQRLTKWRQRDIQPTLISQIVISKQRRHPEAYACLCLPQSTHNLRYQIGASSL